eukprot:GHVH01005010.1.p1 GENE.GHVH01005010.1~~GHVH01005010.1.p1  ORF type:complete len:418 (-),score=41.86 GHVH01005010.1:1087-2340(-)
MHGRWAQMKSPKPITCQIPSPNHATMPLEDPPTVPSLVRIKGDTTTPQTAVRMLYDDIALFRNTIKQVKTLCKTIMDMKREDSETSENIEMALSCGIDTLAGTSPYGGDKHQREGLLEVVSQLLSLVSRAKSCQWNPSLGASVRSQISEDLQVSELNRWHSAILPTGDSVMDRGSHDKRTAFSSTGPHFPPDEGDSMPAEAPILPTGDTAMLNALWMAHTRDYRAPALGGPCRNRRQKPSFPLDFDLIDPDTVSHDIWVPGESVDAPTADVYIKKYGSVPPGFDITEHSDKDEGVIASLFHPVKGVYFVKYNAMWFAEWHDLDRTRHRTRFSVQKYGHCVARALAIEKRAEADRIKNRQLIERNAQLKNQQPQRSSNLYSMSYKIGPTWTGLPDPVDNKTDVKEKPIKRLTKTKRST